MLPSIFISFGSHVAMIGSVAMVIYALRDHLKFSGDLFKRSSIGAATASMLLLPFGLPLPIVLTSGVTCFFATPVLLRHRRTRNYRKEFDAQLAESLQTISASLRAGLTLKESLRVAAETCGSAFASEVRLALKQYHFGVSLEEALEGIRQRVGTTSCNIAIGSMIISTHLGGRLPEMLQKIAHTIREREKVEGKLRSLTAQGRSQAAILVSAPPLLGIGMHFYDPSKMALLTDSWSGQLLLSTAIILELVGIFATLRVMRLEV